MAQLETNLEKHLSASVDPSVKSIHPSLGPGGTDGSIVPEALGTNGYLGVLPDDCRGRTGGDCTIGVSGGEICRVTPDDGQPLGVTGGPCR